jgi:argininosuccinate synthase
MPHATGRLVLACPGPLHPEALVQARALGGSEVVAVTLDFGEGRELEAIRDAALVAGAARAHVLDVRDQFARDFIMPALQAGALGRTDAAAVAAVASLADALWAAKLDEIAAIERADTIGLGGDHPGRIGTLLSGLTQSVAAVAVPGAAGVAGAPLWPTRRAAEPRSAAWPPGTVAPSAAIGFDRGVPLSLNGISMPLAELSASLAALAGTEGAGSPLAALQDAHAALRNAACDPRLVAFADRVAAEYRAIADEGRWFSPLRTALDGFVARVQPAVTGIVRLTIHGGAWSIAQTSFNPKA